jgi:hypothetical protein
MVFTADIMCAYTFLSELKCTNVNALVYMEEVQNTIKFIPD